MERILSEIVLPCIVLTNDFAPAIELLHINDDAEGVMWCSNCFKVRTMSPYR